jgi:hypothetical protein
MYVGGWEFAPEHERRIYTGLVDDFDVREYLEPDSPSANVQFTIGYWRKANAVHKWFVDNVQGGVDECQPAYVPREKLVELRTICLRVLNALELEQQGTQPVAHISETGKFETVEEPHHVAVDPSVAEEQLPTQEGFFFGSTAYDEYYVADLEHTVQLCNRALSMPEGWEFEYQSSW